MIITVGGLLVFAKLKSIGMYIFNFFDRFEIFFNLGVDSFEG